MTPLQNSRRRWLRRIAVLSLSVQSLACGTPPLEKVPGPEVSPAPRVAAPGGTALDRAVTLLSGDRVLVDTATGRVTAVRPGPGRGGIHFTVQQNGKHTHVIPSDAQPLLARNAIDRALFDVTKLIEYGYDDAHSAQVPLLMPAASTGRLAPSIRVRAGAATSPLRALSVEKGKGSAVWNALVSSSGRDGKVWLDGKLEPVLDVSVPQIGAPAAWALGITGKGVTVAVIDTGIDTTHPDLAGKVSLSRNFTPENEPGDVVGHGTHVASTVAGTGAASGGKYRGVAPDAKLIDAKVCSATGGCTFSAILDAMEWVSTEQHARVVNISLGGDDTPDVDPLEEAVNRLTRENGTLFVIAAGNAGPSAMTVGSPGSADAALTVGAVDSKDQLAVFSSRGPRVGDSALKPDLTAPGVDIVAARTHDGPLLGTPVGTEYQSLSGTSMATPHVAGSAALLVQQHPGWMATQLKDTLMASAKPTAGLSVFEQGAGRVDVARAITQAVSSEPASVSLGVALWPHGDDPVITRTVSYRNRGSATVTLVLGIDVRGPTAKPAPAGMFTLDASSLTVPAGESRTVTLTTDTRVNGPDGWYEGALIATAGAERVRTPVAVMRELESYVLTLAPLDSTGAPAATYSGFIANVLDSGSQVDASDYLPASHRLPRGTYWVDASIDCSAADGSPLVCVLDAAAVPLTHDLTLTLDARRTRPVTVQFPDPTVAAVSLGVGMQRPIGGVQALVSHTAYGLGIASAHLGSAAPEAYAFVNSEAARSRAGNFDGSPVFYAGIWTKTGQMFDGFEKTVRRDELATVHALHAQQSPSWLHWKSVSATSSGRASAFATLLQYPAGPFERTEYLLAKDATYYGALLELDDTGAVVAEVDHAGATYSVTGSNVERFNQGVLGPDLPAVNSPLPELTRRGDHLFVYVPLYADSEGAVGLSSVDSSRTTLFREGVKLADDTSTPGYGEFDLPADGARYRVEIESARSISPLSTRVSLAFSFRSGHVAGTVPVKLAASVLRFSPSLDLHNAARAGTLDVIPVTRVQQPGMTATAMKDLSVSVSYDDGASWKQAFLLDVHGRSFAMTWSPASARFASLRAVTEDADGNRTEETILHAYALHP